MKDNKNVNQRKDNWKGGQFSHFTSLKFYLLTCLMLINRCDLCPLKGIRGLSGNWGRAKSSVWKGWGKKRQQKHKDDERYDLSAIV